MRKRTTISTQATLFFRVNRKTEDTYGDKKQNV